MKAPNSPMARFALTILAVGAMLTAKACLGGR